MATSSLSKYCLRAASASQTSLRLSISSAEKRIQNTTPLYLEFLAPAWRFPHVASSSPSKQAFSATCHHLSRITRRTFGTSTPRHARAITNPRQDEAGNDMGITITPRAAHRLQAIAEKDGNPDLALRVSVESGGCHGFQYLMSLISTADVDPTEDTVFENEDVVGKQTGDGYLAKVVMDEPSLELLKGSQIDYTMELIGSQFKVTGIPGAKSSCGCGTSFDIAA